MPISGQCQVCGREFQAPDKLAGKRVRCPSCSAAVELGSADRQPTTSQVSSGDATAQPSACPKRPVAGEAGWYLKTADGRQHGPMSKSRLDRLVGQGQVDGFCYLRREDWDDWRWAEVVYPQFALSAEPESPDEQPESHSPDTEPRLHPCPDCGKMVSKRAIQCPSCGCPLGGPAEQADPVTAAVQSGSGRDHRQPWPVSGQRSSVGRFVEKRKVNRQKQIRLLIAGVALVVAIVVVAVLVAVLQFVQKSNRLLDQVGGEAESVLKSLTTESELPLQPAPRLAPKEKPPQPAPATAQQVQQWMQEASVTAARSVDAEYRKAHLAMALLEGGVQRYGKDVIESLLDNRPPKPPQGKPSPDTRAAIQPYKSQYEALYYECFAYIRQNVAPGRFDRSGIWDMANRWAAGKRTALERQLQEKLSEQLGKGLGGLQP